MTDSKYHGFLKEVLLSNTRLAQKIARRVSNKTFGLIKILIKNG
jgi:hypothetical protein